LPWWTSKSRTCHALEPVVLQRVHAPIATLLKRQKPIARAGVAWCPGGRTAQNARFASPRITMSVAFTTAPAARSAAESERGFIEVSGSR
jgi:hypothetical protein